MASPAPPPRPRGLPGLVGRALTSRRLTARRAARLIAGASLLMTVAGAIAVRLLDRREFDSLGDALWWALQTVTTVGYGDIVPEQTGGRIVGALLMLNGIALLTVITAAVTAVLIEQARRARPDRSDEVLERLERIEWALRESRSPD